MKKKKGKIQVADATQVAQFGGKQASSSSEESDANTGAQVERDQTSEADSTNGIDVLRRQVQELTEKHLRAVAELTNFRRRAAAENIDSLRYATADLARALLPVVDGLERTLAATDDADSSLANGVKLVHQSLLKTLADHHVERIQALDRPFDPSLHEAMMQEESDSHPPGTVLSEYEPGYKLWDRVLRHAKVVVSKQIENLSPAPENQAQPADGTAQ